MIRIQINTNGSVKVPKGIMDKLEWMPGSYLKVSLDGKKVTLEKVAYDPFKEPSKKVDADAFDRMIQEQDESLDRAKETFERKLKEPPPEVRPEDHPDYWR